MTVVRCPICGNSAKVYEELQGGEQLDCPYCNRTFTYGRKKDVSTQEVRPANSAPQRVDLPSAGGGTPIQPGIWNMLQKFIAICKANFFVTTFICISVIGILYVAFDESISPEGSKSAREVTTQDVKQAFITKLNEELSYQNAAPRRRIESAHVTVSVHSAYVVRCDITTFDGTDRVGHDHSNIAQISYLVRFEWAGILDTGYTDLRVVYDYQNERVTKSEIEYTTALINTEDTEFWWNVGYTIGTLLSS